MKMILKNKQFLTVRKVSQMYDLDQTWLYYLIRNKKFPYYKFEKKILIQQSDFENFLNNHKLEIEQ